MTTKRPRRLEQRRYGFTPGGRLDDARAPQTVELAPGGCVQRPPLLALDVDPAVADVRAEREQRLPELRSYPTEPLLCSRVPGGIVATRASIVITPDGRWLRQSVHPGAASIVAPTRLGDRLLRVPAADRHVDEDVAVVFSYFSPKKLRNYHHWTIEGVTRAAMLERAGVPASARVLVPANGGRMHARTLVAIGIEEDRLLLWDGEPTRFRTVYLPTGPQHRGLQPQAAAISLLQAAAARRADGALPARRLWVSRRAAGRRSWSIEAKLIELAAGFGFEEVVPEEIDPAEQAALFGSAEAIAGPHGAGLANASYMPPGGTVVEVTLEGIKPRTKPLFWNLASAAGHRYACCVGPDEAGVDPGRFEQLLASVFG